jgi:serine/threonine protein kinase
LAGLDHENILRLKGIILGDELPDVPVSLVTEFCEGGCLFDLLHNSEVPLTWAQRRGALKHAARGIEYLHTRTPPVIHRDVKSQNLLLVHEVNSHEDEIFLKVADFGLCRTLGLDKNRDTRRLTCDVGTFSYMAPEVMWRQGEYNLAADVYSFGVVIYETLAREPPFASEPDPGELCNRVAMGFRPDQESGFDPEREEALDGICPCDLPRLMRICWDAEPSTRPVFTEIRRWLEAQDPDNLLD